jgi:hypothetical protein
MFQINPYSFAGAPTVQASNVTIDNISATQFRINCTAGNGNGRLFVVRVGEAVNSEPENGETYTANTTFGSGEELPVLGNFVVGSGAITTVTVNHAGDRMRYDVQVFEFNGTAYNVTSAPTGSVVDARLHTNLVRLIEPDLIAQADGTEITTYTEVKGAVLAPGAADKRPTFETNVINGHSVIDFASGDTLRSATKTDWDFLHQGSHTLIWVAKNDVDNATVTFFTNCLTSSGTTRKGINIFYAATQAVRVHVHNGSGTALLFSTIGANNMVPAGSFHLVVSRFELGVGHTLEVNNVSAGSSSQVGSPTADTADANPIFGANTAQSASFCPMDLAYLAGFNTAISEAAINDLTGGLDFS